jgi:hypothetical protein
VHIAAGIPTTGLAAAAADQVSTAVAALFAEFGQEYQTRAAQASVFHQEFVQALMSGAGSYQAAKAASTSMLRTAVDYALRRRQCTHRILAGAPADR